MRQLKETMMRTFLMPVLVSSLLLSSGGCARAMNEGSTKADVGVSLADIKVSFKLDPRLTKGLYMGERWVSPPTYTATQEGKELTLDARAHGLDAQGKARNIRPTWTPVDPEMVTVAPGQGNEVQIMVKQAGLSTVKVASPDFSKELSIKATYEGNTIHVEIAQ